MSTSEWTWNPTFLPVPAHTLCTHTHGWSQFLCLECLAVQQKTIRSSILPNLKMRILMRHLVSLCSSWAVSYMIMVWWLTSHVSAEDEGEVMDQSNIVGDRLRQAQPVSSTKYHEMEENEIPNNEAQWFCDGLYFFFRILSCEFSFWNYSL